MKILPKALLALLASVSLAASSMSAGAIVAGFNTTSLDANDDDSTGLLAIGFAINFFGTPYSFLYANNNGNMTFTDPLYTYTPFDLLSTSTPIIAPYFADVDTRGSGSALMTYGTGTFDGHSAFGVTWDGVGYYDSYDDLLNKFQALLVDRSDVGAGDFDIYFNYDQILWETGDASSGSGGFGGDSARAGYSNGVDTAYEFAGSAVNGGLLDGNAITGLVNHSNVGVDGRYLLTVRNGVVAPPSVPDSASTLALLGLALAGFAAFRRRILTP